MIVLVHHGDALGPDVDPMRPLSPLGRAATARIAEIAAARDLRPDVVWHSGKLRARQTAELYRRACNPLATFGAVHGLQPDDPPAWMRDKLVDETRSIMLVGHMPHLPRLLALLTGLRPGDPAPAFPLHGFVVLDREDDRWKEMWKESP